jgi:hypothetical protein
MRVFLSWVLLLSIVWPQTYNKNIGTKVVVRYTSGDHTSEFTTYTMGDRRRTEFRNSAQRRNAAGVLEYVDPPDNVTIQRCDLRQRFTLNTSAKEYTSAVYPPKPLTPEEIAERGFQEPEDAYVKPAIRIEERSLDTGEREEAFGRVARHVITKEKKIFLDGAQEEDEQVVADGWYIDFNRSISCEPKPREGAQVSSFIGVNKSIVRVPKTEYVQLEPRERGFAIKETKSPKTQDSSTTTYEIEVTQFVEGPLDPALFEVPPEFNRVQFIQWDHAK